MYKSIEYFYEDCEFLTGYNHFYPDFENRVTSTISNYSNSIDSTKFYTRVRVKKIIEGNEHIFISDLIEKDKENIKFAFLQDIKFLIWYDECNISDYYFDPLF